MRSLFTLFLFLFFSFFTLGQQKYPSLLWKIEGNGLSKPSYLYGTMHVSSKIAFNLSDEFFEALTSADAIALETNPEFWLSYYRDSGLVEVAEYFVNSDRFYGDYGIYDRITASSEFDLDLIQQFFRSQEPMLNQLLYRFNYGQENYEETTYLDMFIFQSAKKKGKPIYSLEDFIEAQLLVERSSIPDEDSEDEDYDLLGYNYNGQMDLETAYLERNLDLIDSLISKNFSKNYRKYLLTIRNENMVTALDSLMPKQSIFAGVGAAHLPGETGMIQMLREKGYSVTPSNFKRSSKAKKTFKKLKNSAIDLPTSKFTSSDGKISIEAPGRFYKDESYFGMSADAVNFSPDYANGAYYNYERLKKRYYDKDALHVQSLSYIDSVLYLITPGNIQKNKSIKVSGYDAIEVITELPRGNYMRFVCVDTPEELIVFKAGGNKSFIKSKNVKKYFKSISIQTPPENEMLKKVNISIDLPERTAVSVNDNGTFDIVAWENGDFYTIKSNLLIDFSDLEQDLFEVNYLIDKFADNREYEVLKKDTLSTKNMMAKIKGEEDKLFFINIQIFHNNYYLLTSNASKEKAKSFFDSFSPRKAVEDIDLLTTVNDTVGGFNVISYDRKEVSDELLEAYKSLMTDFKKAHQRKDSLDYDYSSDRTVRTFRHPNSGEVINVTVERKNVYQDMHDVIDGIQEDLHYEYEGDDFRSYQYRLLNEHEAEGQYQAEYVQTKEGTTRIIKNKVFVEGNRVLTVSASYDTLLGKTVFVDTFFSTFTPVLLPRDTVDYKKPRCKEWIHDLQSENFQLSEQAKKSISVVSIDSTCKENFEQLLFNDTLDLGKNNVTSLIYRVNDKWSDEEKLDLFQSYYEKNKLNSSKSKAALKAIGNIKTESSTKEFMSILMDNPPIIKNDYEFYRLFNVFDDSMALLKPHLEDFQEFGMEYDEYLPTVIYYLDRGIFEKEFTTAVISKEFEDFLLKRVNRNLRRMAYSESGAGSDYNKTRDEVLETFSILHSYPNSSKKFEDLIAKSDTITDKKYRAHLLAKRINRGNDYMVNEIDSVVADTNYLFSFFQWLDDDSLRQEIFTQHKIDTSLFYLSYLKENNGYRSIDDEAEFLKKAYASTFGEEGTVYLYSSKRSYGGLELKAVYFIDDNKGAQIKDIQTKSISYSKDDDLDEKIEMILEQISHENRPRVSEDNMYGGFEGLF
jgi:uncharacterized protein YbaP (TraB family)